MHFGITFRLSLVSVSFRATFSHPYISFFHLLVNGSSVLAAVLYSRTPYNPYNGGHYRWVERT